MAYAPEGDRALVGDLLSGNEEAFTWLVERYHAQLLRLARAFVSSDAVGEEVVQEVWLAVLNGLAKFEGRSSLKTWIFRILTNRAKTRGVREGRTVPFSALGDGSDSNTSAEPEHFNRKGMWQSTPAKWSDDAPERVALDKEARQVIEKAIAELPGNQAAVVTMRDVQGWASDEVCEILGVSESNQRVLLHRARSKLRGVLAAYLAGEKE